MFSKATLFACVIAAATFGCRNVDRTDRDTSFGRTIESDNTGAEVTRDTPASETIMSDEAGHTVHDTAPTPAQPAPMTSENPAPGAADIDDDADTSSIPTAGGTDRIPVENGADTATGADTPEAQPSAAGEGAGANSGLSETASGHGSPTNTGVNTENAGTGGTDDPSR